MTAAEEWRDALASWAIPPEILAAAPENPWTFSPAVFARAADEGVSRDTPSFRLALEALPVGGSVLDVGCGAGAASLPLAPPAARLVGVDSSADMLSAFAERAARLGVDHEETEGRWPDVAEAVAPADVVVCHHVLYNVADLPAFAAALTEHATRRVVVEITAEHPRSWMNPLWLALHGIERPARPTAADAGSVLTETGIAARVERWRKPMISAREGEKEQVEMTRVALCLPAERDPDVARALAEHPPPADREIATLWWDA